MSHYKSEFLNIMSERGFIHQLSDAEGLDALMAKNSVSAYIGFDPTAASLHVGSLIQIMMLYWLQQTGHRPIALMGGGTGLVGDPSFKDEARLLLAEDNIAANIAGIRQVFAHYLQFGKSGDKNKALLLNNADWLRNIDYLQFLRDIGRHFSVNRMLSFDSVKLRLEREQSLSFLEFNYMILQAYDFVELHKTYNVRLQMGGSDQWGNIINGIDLGHRLGTKQLYALTSPLLTTASGQKMGKSLGGAVWLNADWLSPYQFWQFWRNCEDADIIRFLKLYTILPLAEIARLAKVKDTEINEVKKILATEVTALLHGRKAAENAAETARKVFEEGSLGKDLPQITLPAAEFDQGIGLLTLLVKAGLAKSNGEARRHIQGGAIRINDKTATDETQNITIAEADNNIIKLSFGRKKHVLIKIA
ncbi:MAG: tyrosine--tRNA ligase [Candidatus Tokpelaia sp.]|uniref:tyrosine--tRNA ligase n=1 Tax=Candidatus Tokpelaia sp. TaxID=2233777 RepID=UPI0012393570|nr:tyrosine--tRNA ligase [Candidatus Tokpelaia sp.]KAA6204882.1 MAG: tyrosine--tRNA ligase [Candidatus Tokpelaia sp.]KAA6207810.1 MAG: tyrosine--tRNA ligase [Candidatus Tokpelaia sp.]KAA6405003.1 tyrosine--tRNA ligase [Candidatus Tokpelaia sp.]